MGDLNQITVVTFAPSLNLLGRFHDFFSVGSKRNPKVKIVENASLFQQKQITDQGYNTSKG